MVRGRVIGFLNIMKFRVITFRGWTAEKETVAPTANKTKASLNIFSYRLKSALLISSIYTS